MTTTTTTISCSWCLLISQHILKDLISISRKYLDQTKYEIRLPTVLWIHAVCELWNGKSSINKYLRGNWHNKRKYPNSLKNLQDKTNCVSLKYFWLWHFAPLKKTQRRSYHYITFYVPHIRPSIFLFRKIIIHRNCNIVAIFNISKVFRRSLNFRSSRAFQLFIRNCLKHNIYCKY